jgi:hypothetical protein
MTAHIKRYKGQLYIEFREGDELIDRYPVDEIINEEE